MPALGACFYLLGGFSLVDECGYYRLNRIFNNELLHIGASFSFLFNIPNQP